MKKIYVLHGWAYSTDKWEPFISELQKNRIEVEMLKIPGLTAPLNSVWGLDDYVDWLKKIVDREKNKVILLGHSNGGRISLGFASKYPEKIEKLILIDSAGIYHNEFHIRLKRFILGSLAKAGKKITASSSMRKLLYRFAKENDYLEASPIGRKTMSNLIKSDLKNVLDSIKNQTIIIWGKEDSATSINDGKVLNKGIKDSKFFVIDSARHSPMFTHVKEVAKIICENI